jgi:hypothetical protein
VLSEEGIAQLTKRIEGADHLLPAFDRPFTDVLDRVHRRLRGLADRLEDVLVREVPDVLGTIVAPARDLRAVLAAEVGGAELDAGADEAAVATPIAAQPAVTAAPAPQAPATPPAVLVRPLARPSFLTLS